ncbi:AAA family ATPase [Candidatus Xianfuyuplasma coldseepsis]|uniref:EVE domain-containing protein n=1 Tax=Candidatus Xianfuyuplasma coldseepsis TaxID=2782163 RepID=A0A7L7KSC9_9MOLU|nr:AAA family ATPase [Xianfuyuplasma coldseepsis]QMS85116.1 EVE domain-containing protein [Xianfuyuplasma coldseepsis]
MYNEQNLAEILNTYKDSFNSAHWVKEGYKWEAVKHFQNNWDINAHDFKEMFLEATSKTNNLLASMNFYPRKMLEVLIDFDDEKVRSMFLNLYDESKDLLERVQDFKQSADDMKNQYSNDDWNNHYQNANVISTYLWLRFPDKYYIYKYSLIGKFAKKIGSNFKPKRGKLSAIIDSYSFLDEVKDYINYNFEMKSLLEKHMSEEHYDDPELNTLIIDFEHYTARYLDEVEPEWFPANYTPNISVEEWVDLIKNPDVFNDISLQIIKRFKDYGGIATCKQLSIKYGETPGFYNMGSTALSKRVVTETNCEVISDNEENSRWWPVLYVGKKASKEEAGTYVWKLRDELSDALDQVDLSDVELFVQASEETGNINYWWLNASPKVWSFSNIAVGESHFYTSRNENGNKRRIYQNFVDAKPGDMLIGYESNPVKQIVALLKVTDSTSEENLHFEKIEGLENPLDYSLIKSMSELQGMEYFSNPNGSLFKLSEGEYNFLLDMIRDVNPKQLYEIEPYGTEDFLDEVYISKEQFLALKELLKNKLNIILQGAPGVGKTFIAKRLAYAMMEQKDVSRIEFIQFHQNYSYEDFIMGYKPMGEGFELVNGIFYKFCMKAANNPNKSYFFIIDEINRGNMSKIFGELLMLIEKDYRNSKATLAYNGMSFSVPANVHLIGMMNTADRSLAMIDYALRRRFSFYEMSPGFDSDGFKRYQKSLDNETFDDLIGKITELNQEITKDKSLGRGFNVGHSFFCGQKICTEEWMRQVIEFDIIPMLNEYWFDDDTKVRKWENILRGVFDE